MNFNEHDTQPYDWDAQGVYVIEPTDPVEGGQEGVSNRQAKELTRRTRNLHTRLATAQGDIDTLQEQTPIQVEAALRSANTYTDGKDTVLRSDMAIADTAAINAAKSYADRVVAALVDNSPEALNTLQELAAALGGDPNFATTVMQAIGERMKTADVTAALAGKANTSHGHTASDLSGVLKALSDSPNADDMGMGIAQTNGRGIVSLHQHTYNELQFDYPLNTSPEGTQLRFRQRNNDTAAHFPWREIYHTGNLHPLRALSVGNYNCNEPTYNSIVVSDPVTTNAPYYSPNWQILTLGGATRSFQLAHSYDSEDYFMRKSTDGGWQGWVELYHSGNLGDATQGATGLMSAADKTKLDRITHGLIAAGRASRNGGFIKRFGPHANSIIVTHSGGGRYVILHDLGHTEYVTTITPCERYDNTWQLGATIIAETPNYVELCITENEYTRQADFNFEIMGRL